MTVALPKTEHNYIFNLENIDQFAYNPATVAFDEWSAFNVSPDGEIGVIQTISPLHLTYVDYTTIDCNQDELLRLQISIDGHRWYFFNDTTLGWQKVSSNHDILHTEVINETCTVSGFIENIHEFAWEIGDGGVQLKFFLLPGAEIRNQYFKYVKHYANIQDVKRTMQQYALIRLNPFSQLPEDFINFDLVKERMLDVDSYIDSETQRDFLYHENQREWHDGNGSNKLILRFFPILDLHYLVMYNQMLQAMRTFLDSEIIFGQGGEWGELFLPPIYPAYLTDHPVKSLFGNVFISGYRNIEVFYDWGYKETPVDIQTAAKKLMVIYILNDFLAYLSRGGNSRSIDGYSESYSAKGPYSAIIEQFQREVDRIISRRKRIYARFA